MNVPLSHCAALSLTAASAVPENSAVDANTRFALDLYAQLAEENPDKNLFFSPYSVSSALAMTAEGARGGTALEMGTVLGLPKGARAGDKNRPWDLSGLHTGIGALNTHFNRDDKPYALSVANSIWGEKTFPFNKAFIETLNSSYDTNALRLANFKGNAEGERTRINTWVEEQTQERIKDLLPEGSLDALTRMVLTNAIYFKGDWKFQFKEKATREGEFKLPGGETSKAQLMNQRSMKGVRYAAFKPDGSYFDTPQMMDRRKAKAAYYPTPTGFAIAELPYKGDELSMVVIAPNEADGLAAIESKLNRENLDAWLGKLKGRKVHVTLPKFKSETKYTMNGTLKAMGMPSAFGRSSNFNGMVEGESEADLYISLVIHKAFVEVNEEGTEAAAATAVVIKARSASISTPFIPEFRADKPFIYLIRDNKSGSILFLGRMNNPGS